MTHSFDGRSRFTVHVFRWQWYWQEGGRGSIVDQKVQSTVVLTQNNKRFFCRRLLFSRPTTFLNINLTHNLTVFASIRVMQACESAAVLIDPQAVQKRPHTRVASSWLVRTSQVGRFQPKHTKAADGRCRDAVLAEEVSAPSLAPVAFPFA